jgi:hypothetical protein
VTRIAIDSSSELATPRPIKASDAPTCFDGECRPVASALMIVVPPSSPTSPAVNVRISGK